MIYKLRCDSVTLITINIFYILKHGISFLFITPKLHKADEMMSWTRTRTRTSNSDQKLELFSAPL